MFSIFMCLVKFGISIEGFCHFIMYSFCFSCLLFLLSLTGGTLVQYILLIEACVARYVHTLRTYFNCSASQDRYLIPNISATIQHLWSICESFASEEGCHIIAEICGSKFQSWLILQ